ncbi:TPA: type A2 lantipeptide [Streptococcus pyogenes]|uniref:lacticin 481 family lantibiotic n=1 Tax=Streptococcus pyogenes TaxID=1314 RepID=UPI00109CC0FD|nr:lacticin 481 family lantibiotic [Streptococcus pyogenes]VGR83883.1 Lantibiotic macedocin [Streptococcus pyogenes]HEQ8841873.1 type A2 lantipeptide [Streptococcus pyogenes]
MTKEHEIINSIQEVSLEELDQIIGAGKNGVFKTISHECHLNTWAFLAICCS